MSSILNRFLNHFHHDPTWPRPRFYWKTNGFLRFLLFHCCVVALMSWSIFDRFWEPLGLKNRSKIDQKSIQKSIKKLIQFLIDFGANLAPFWRGFGSQVGAKLAPKSIQEAIKKSIKCWIDFISIFHRFWCPRGPQEPRPNLLNSHIWGGHVGSWSQDGPKTPQDPPKTPPRPPKTPQNGAKMAPRPPNLEPRWS